VTSTQRPCFRSAFIVHPLLCISAAHAQADPGLPLWEFGAFGVGVSQQAYPGSSAQVNRVLALPYLVYRGEILRADRGAVGLRAVKTTAFELDVGVAAAFGSNADDSEARRGMPNLGTLVEIGPRLRWKLGAGPGGGQWRAEFPWRGVFDLSDHLAHKGMAFEPTLLFERRAQRGWQYHASFGVVRADRRLADTFYGVAPIYATPQRPAYTARSGLAAWRLGTSVSYRVTPDLRLFAFARLDSVAGAANVASPLVDRRTGSSVGLGLTYTLARSERAAVD
jgi:outer membrane scaffolding protein for murein synthesis (MipA/OmpV family)